MKITKKGSTTNPIYEAKRKAERTLGKKLGLLSKAWEARKQKIFLSSTQKQTNGKD